MELKKKTKSRTGGRGLIRLTQDSNILRIIVNTAMNGPFFFRKIRGFLD